MFTLLQRVSNAHDHFTCTFGSWVVVGLGVFVHTILFSSTSNTNTRLSLPICLSVGLTSLPVYNVNVSCINRLGQSCFDFPAVMFHLFVTYSHKRGLTGYIAAADMSARQRSEGQSLFPPLVCPTSTNEDFFCYLLRYRLDSNIKMKQHCVYFVTVPW